jgi:anti-sigma B factor antagonist
MSIDAYVKTTTIDGVCVVTGEGELDAYSADALRNALVESCTTHAARVVVDLTNVPFIDSTALGVLVGGLRRVREVEGEILVVLPRGAARRVFEITTLDRVLPTAASRHDAIGQLAGRDA